MAHAFSETIVGKFADFLYARVRLFRRRKRTNGYVAVFSGFVIATVNQFLGVRLEVLLNDADYVSFFTALTGICVSSASLLVAVYAIVLSTRGALPDSLSRKAQEIVFLARSREKDMITFAIALALMSSLFNMLSLAWRQPEGCRWELGQLLVVYAAIGFGWAYIFYIFPVAVRVIRQFDLHNDVESDIFGRKLKVKFEKMTCRPLAYVDEVAKFLNSISMYVNFVNRCAPQTFNGAGALDGMSSLERAGLLTREEVMCGEAILDYCEIVRSGLVSQVNCGIVAFVQGRTSLIENKLARLKNFQRSERT